MQIESVYGIFKIYTTMSWFEHSIICCKIVLSCTINMSNVVPSDVSHSIIWAWENWRYITIRHDCHHFTLQIWEGHFLVNGTKLSVCKLLDWNMFKWEIKVLIQWSHQKTVTISRGNDAEFMFLCEIILNNSNDLWHYMKLQCCYRHSPML